NRQLLDQSGLRLSVGSFTACQRHITNIDRAAAVSDIAIESHATACLTCQFTLTVPTLVGLQVAQAGNRLTNTPVTDSNLEVAIIDILLMLLELDTTPGDVETKVVQLGNGIFRSRRPVRIFLREGQFKRQRVALIVHPFTI